jgi:carbohydrate-selective porin OprB
VALCRSVERCRAVRSAEDPWTEPSAVSSHGDRPKSMAAGKPGIGRSSPTITSILMDAWIGKSDALVNGEDLADFSCEFTNLALCGSPPGNIAINYWYNWSVSSWGTRLKQSLRGWGYLEIGAFEFNPRFLMTEDALNLSEPGGATGVLAPFEIGWLPRFGEGHDGTYKFGGWYNSSRAPDVVENTKGQNLLLDGGQPRIHPGE